VLRVAVVFREHVDGGTEWIGVQLEADLRLLLSFEIGGERKVEPLRHVKLFRAWQRQARRKVRPVVGHDESPRC